MKTATRGRFIAVATASYAVAALAWIFLSDRLLAVFTDIESIVWLSSAKGVFFVVVTAALFFFAMQSVPPKDAAAGGTFLDALTAGLTERKSRWPMYLFAVAVTLAMLMVRQGMAVSYGERPMLILFVLPIVLSAVLGGLGPGLLSTAVAGLATAYFVLPPIHSFRVESSHDLILLCVLVVDGIAVSMLSEMLRISVTRTEEKRRLLDAVVSGTSDAVFIKDLQGHYLMANAAAARFVDKPVNEILGRDDTQLFSAASARLIMDTDRSIVQDGQPHTHEERVTKLNGDELVFLVTKGPVLDRSKKAIGLFGISRDITERKAFETALRTSEQRFQMAVEATGDGLWDWDMRTGYVYRSPKYYEAYGCRPEDDTHDFAFFMRSVHPDDLAHALQTIETHRQGKTTGIDFEHRLVTSAGTVKWMHAKGRVVERDLDGSPLRMVGTTSDISDKKRAAALLLERERRLARVIDGSDQGYWDWNLQTNTFEVSARWERMLGYAPGEMDVSAENWSQLVHPEDLSLALESIRRHTHGETSSHELEFRARTKSGEWRWILTRGRIVERSDDGKPLIMSGTHTDVTERKGFEIAHREASTVFVSSYEGIMVVSPQITITKVNPAFTRITGYSADEAVGHSPSMLSSGRHDAAFYRTMWEAIAQHDFWSGEVWDRRKNGEIFAELLSISAVRDAQGVIQHYVGVFSDISQIKAHETELDRIAHYDPLTGTPNRRLLSDRLDQAIMRTARSGRLLALCFLDLDGFKEINDRYGHSAGDAMLVGVTRNLQHVLRGDDTLARLGGDEFVLLLSDIATPQECSLILNRVLQAAGTPVTLEGQSVTVSASVGVSLYPTDNSQADALLRHADQAMYLAKEAGKNRYHLFDPDNDRKAQQHRKFLDVLRKALDQEEFVLHYQPKVNLISGELVGVEALIRWQHPERGLLAPAEFLPFIDGSELERPLGDWVIDAALAQAAAWSRQGLRMGVSANVSASHLLHPDFYDQLRHALQRHGDVRAGSFELEVLETAALADMDQAVAVLRRC